MDGLGLDHAQRFPLTILTVVRDEGSSRKERLLGRGVKFPTGMVIMSWYLDAYPPSERLDGHHESIYASIKDLKQATRGEVYIDGEV